MILSANALDDYLDNDLNGSANGSGSDFRSGSNNEGSVDEDYDDKSKQMSFDDF